MPFAEPVVATFNGNSVVLYDAHRTLLRRFSMNCEVVSAQVVGSGNETCVMIMMANGHWELRHWTAQLLRRG